MSRGASDLLVTYHALAQRRHVLFTMLTTLGYRYPAGQEPPVIAGIRKYLDGWPGVGRIIAGMARQQYDLQLTRFGQDGWSVTFYRAGIAHHAVDEQVSHHDLASLTVSLTVPSRAPPHAAAGHGGPPDSDGVLLHLALNQSDDGREDRPGDATPRHLANQRAKVGCAGCLR